MARVLLENEIDVLLTEAKPLPANWANRLRLRRKSDMTYEQRDYEIESASGHIFKLVLRRNVQSPLDFSVVLVYTDDDGVDYRLRRHNGAHPSKHTNKWEKMQGMPNYQLQIGFHIHMATERYQQAGLDIDGFAEHAERYNDFDGAFQTMIRDGGFVVPSGGESQLSLTIPRNT